MPPPSLHSRCLCELDAATAAAPLAWVEIQLHFCTSQCTAERFAKYTPKGTPIISVLQIPLEHEVHTGILFTLAFSVPIIIPFDGTLGGAKMQLKRHPGLMSFQFRAPRRTSHATDPDSRSGERASKLQDARRQQRRARENMKILFGTDFDPTFHLDAACARPTDGRGQAGGFHTR